ncbi:unnamed protein product [Durusdinium trenchii]|uniref:Uncharacterized protein n=1 Tax=Durusdinium trenchii TaxID=1381693 RepID=A0ABP0LN97_9DINO
MVSEVCAVSSSAHRSCRRTQSKAFCNGLEASRRTADRSHAALQGAYAAELVERDGRAEGPAQSIWDRSVCSGVLCSGFHGICTIQANEHLTRPNIRCAALPSPSQNCTNCIYALRFKMWIE